jgi:hypothetical protein
VQAALEDLDDDRFTRFCQYKAAEWSIRSIKRELGFDDVMYEAALARLRALRDQMVEADPEDEEPDVPPDVPAPFLPDEEDEEEPPGPLPPRVSPAPLVPPGAGPTFADEAARRGWLKDQLTKATVSAADLARHLGVDPREFRKYLNAAPKQRKEFRDPAFLTTLTERAATWFARQRS